VALDWSTYSYWPCIQRLATCTIRVELVWRTSPCVAPWYVPVSCHTALASSRCSIHTQYTYTHVPANVPGFAGQLRSFSWEGSVCGWAPLLRGVRGFRTGIAREKIEDAFAPAAQRIRLQPSVDALELPPIFGYHVVPSVFRELRDWQTPTKLRRMREWVSRGLTSHSTLYRSFRGRFLQARWHN